MTMGPLRGAAGKSLAETLVDGVRLGLALLAPGGEIRLANPAAEELLGYGRGELTGRTLADLYGPEARRAGAAEGALMAARRDGRVEDEGPRARRDGSSVRASFVLTALAPGEAPDAAAFI